jgi:uridylate kinase
LEPEPEILFYKIPPLAWNSNADVILKGTRVDGVYDCDPEKNESAVKFDFISFEDVLKKV